MNARTLLLVLLGSLTLPAQAAEAAAVPPRIRISYQVSIGPLKIGEGTDLFEHAGRRYKVVSESHTTGMAAALYKYNIRRESQGDVVARTLRPQSFSEQRNSSPLRGAKFDWEAATLTLEEGGERRETVPLPPHTWDTTSFAYNFAFTPPVGKEIELHLTDGKRLTAYRYAILGREKISTPLGEFEALHVKKVQEDDDKRAFDVWLAVTQHYLPIRIRYTEKDGTAFESSVTAISYPAN